MRLKARLFCIKCMDYTVHEWVGVTKIGEWIFRCTKCGDRKIGPEEWIEWLDEEEEAEKK